MQNWADRLGALLFGIREMADGGTLLVDSEGQPREYSQLNAVYPLRAAANTAESRFDLSIEPTALVPSVPTGRTAYVDAVYGSDIDGEVGERTFPYQTVKAAMTAIQLLGPSTSNTYLCQVHPGTYSEDNPIALLPGVTLTSSDGPGTVTILPQDDTAAIFTGTDGANIKGVTLSGANGVGGAGIRYIDLLSNPPGRLNVYDCRIVDCTTGIEQEGSGSFISLVHSKFLKGTSMQTAVSSVDASPLNGSGYFVLMTEISGNPGDNLPVAVLSDSSFVRFGAQVIIGFTDSGLYTENNGIIVGTDVSFSNTDKPFHISSTSGLISVGTFAIIGDGIITIESATGQLITGSGVHSAEPEVAAGAGWFGLIFNEPQQTAVIEGSLRVGSATRPAVTYLGGGGVHISGLRAFWGDNVEAGTLTEVTDDVISASGSAIDLVPGLGVGNSFFLGSDVPLPGAYFDVVIAQNGGTLVPKYWDGGGGVWAPIPQWMTAEAFAPYASTGNALFAATGKQDQRWDGPLSGDAAKALGGTGVLKYWYLWEVTSALTTAPRVEQVKLHTDHTRFGRDGAQLYYGDARPYGYIDVDWRPSGGTAPGTSVVSYTANVTSLSPAAFQASPTPRELSYPLIVPRDCDTSAPLELLLDWYPTTTNSGALQLSLYYVRVPVGATLAGGLAGEQLIALTPTPPGVIGKTTRLSYPMLLPSAIAGTDGAALVLRRVGGDAFTGTAVISKSIIRYRKWRS